MRTSSTSDGTPTRAQVLRDAELLRRYLQTTLPPTPPDALHPAPADARAAAVLVPLYALSGEPWLFVTRRTEHLRQHGGQISFPGGRQDPTDETLWATALRESEEEVAITPSAVTLLGALPPFYAAVSNHLVQPYVGWLGGGRPLAHANPHEVAEIVHLPLHALADPAAFHEEIWERDGLPHTVYFYDVESTRIWGLTGVIVHSLLATLPPA